MAEPTAEHEQRLLREISTLAEEWDRIQQRRGKEQGTSALIAVLGNSIPKLYQQYVRHAEKLVEATLTTLLCVRDADDFEIRTLLDEETSPEMIRVTLIFDYPDGVWSGEIADIPADGVPDADEIYDGIRQHISRYAIYQVCLRGAMARLGADRDQLLSWRAGTLHTQLDSLRYTEDGAVTFRAGVGGTFQAFELGPDRTFDVPHVTKLLEEAFADEVRALL